MQIDGIVARTSLCLVEFASNIHVSDMIKNMNGTIKNDYKIDTTKLGTKKIKFNFTNDDGITIP